MSDTAFTTQVTVIEAAWLNELNKLAYWGRNPNFATTTGTANVQVLTLASGSLYTAGSEASGDEFYFAAGFTNTGATTLQVKPTGGSNTARAVQLNGQTLVGGEIVVGQVYKVSRVGTTWQLEFTQQQVDGQPVAVNSADITKKMKFALSGFTTATTRTKTWQDQSGTVYESGGTDIPITDGGTGASTALAAFDNLKQAATTAYQGAVTLATQAQMNAGTAAVVATTDLNKVFLGAPTTTTSGTTVPYTSLPTGIREFSFDFVGVSLSGTDNFLLQLSQSATFLTSTYVSTSVISVPSASNSTNATSTAGAIVAVGSAATTVSGRFEGKLIDSSTNTWTIAYSGMYSSGNIFHGFATVSLAGTLDGVRLATDGSNTFDLGKANLQAIR